MTTTTARYEQRRLKKDTEMYMKKVSERRAPKDAFDLMYNVVMSLTPNRRLVVPSRKNGIQTFVPENEVHEARVSAYKRLLYKVSQEREAMLPEKQNNITLDVDPIKMHASLRNMETNFDVPQVTLELKLIQQNEGPDIYQARINLGTNLERGSDLLKNVKLGRRTHVYSAKADAASSEAYKHLRL